jgi:hypothetical protein
MEASKWLFGSIRRQASSRSCSAACLCAPPQPSATAQDKGSTKATEFLFVQTAKDIAYKEGVLTLQDVSPVTVFFSDRPQRIVGHVRNDLFEKMDGGEQQLQKRSTERGTVGLQRQVATDERRGRTQ